MANLMESYSFKDVLVTLIGVGVGTINFDDGSLHSVKVTMGDSKNVQKKAAGGAVLNVLKAQDSATIEIEVLAASPANQALSAAYNLQKQSAITWGKNIITVKDRGLNDLFTLTGCAFQKMVDITKSEEVENNVWIFDVAIAEQYLGGGVR